VVGAGVVLDGAAVVVAPAEGFPDVRPEAAAPASVDDDCLADGDRPAVRVGSGLGGELVLAARVGAGDDATCGQIVRSAMSGGSRRPPSCQTQASVDPGAGSWLPAPRLA
jgi:hypothetical protein